MRNPRQTFLPGVFYVYWSDALFAIPHNKFPHKGYAELVLASTPWVVKIKQIPPRPKKVARRVSSPTTTFGNDNKNQ